MYHYDIDLNIEVVFLERSLILLGSHQILSDKNEKIDKLTETINW